MSAVYETEGAVYQNNGSVYKKMGAVYETKGGFVTNARCWCQTKAVSDLTTADDL